MFLSSSILNTRLFRKIFQRMPEISNILEEKNAFLEMILFGKSEKTLLKIKCKNNHIFNTTWKECLTFKRWCKDCYKLEKLDNLKLIAKNRGGQCLSNIYENKDKKMLWRCSVGHIWSASSSSIKNSGQWCPDCNISLSEEICRVYFETIFGESFFKSRFDWLINERTNRKLELDGYCEKLNIAFEHNGALHYDKSPYYSENVSFKDNLKKQLCEKQNVKLFIINELFVQTKLKDLITCIKQQSLKLNIALPFNIDDIKIDISKAYNKSFYHEYENVALSRGAIIVKNTYINSHENCIWECKYGHRWRAKPTSVKNSGIWCRRCHLMSLGDFYAFAISKGGFCLSIIAYEFINKKSKLKWQCESGHIFKKTGEGAKRYWCNECNKKNRKNIKIKKSDDKI